MKIKSILFALISLLISGCSSDISIWEYIGGKREYNGLIYRVVPSGTLISDFSSELEDDQIIYIPSSIRNYWTGEPMPIVVGESSSGQLASDTLKVLYINGGQTTFGSQYLYNLEELELIVLNTVSSTVRQLETAIFPWHTQAEVEVGLTLHCLLPHEVYENVVRFYYDSESANIVKLTSTPAALVSSRASYYYNYPDSPNDGLYRIGMEYETGANLVPPEEPSRIKSQDLFGIEYYTFIGWSRDDTTFIPYDFETSDDDIDMQLYAHWE